MCWNLEEIYGKKRKEFFFILLNLKIYESEREREELQNRLFLCVMLWKILENISER